MKNLIIPYLLSTLILHSREEPTYTIDYLEIHFNPLINSEEVIFDSLIYQKENGQQGVFSVKLQ